MIDIHSHVVPFVDDGSKSLEASLRMLKNAEAQGVKVLYCTPHFRYGRFESGKDRVLENYALLQDEAKKNGIGVRLLLGQEVHYNKEITSELDKGMYLTLNGSKYVLVEFSFTVKTPISDSIYNIVHAGYKPIVAHFERYSYAELDEAYEIHALGGDIQINADSVVGTYGGKIKKFAHKLLKNDLVDYVAGDIHETRVYNMEKAAKIIGKKYGEERRDRLFRENALKFTDD